MQPSQQLGESASLNIALSQILKKGFSLVAGQGEFVFVPFCASFDYNCGQKNLGF
jgi:hypothetical protein